MYIPADLLIIHPHRQIREALTARLGQDRSLRVVASIAAVPAVEALSLFSRCTTVYGLSRADHLPDPAVRARFASLCEETRVIVLFSYLDSAVKLDLQRYGVRCCLPLSLDLEPLFAAIAALQQSRGAGHP